MEFLFYLQEYQYKDDLTFDTAPTRWDIKRTFETNARMSNKIWDLLYRIDWKKLKALLQGEDYLETWEFIKTEIFSLK